MSNSKPTQEGTQSHTQEQALPDRRTDSNVDEVGIRDSVVKSFTDTVDGPALLHGNESINKELLKESSNCRTKTPLEDKAYSSER